MKVTEVRHEFTFKRRRYGRQFYTWAFVEYAGAVLSLGDPWPCATPKRSELEAEARRAIERADSTKEVNRG